MKPRTCVNGFLVDRDLASRIIIAVAQHDPRQCPRGFGGIDPQVRGEIDLLASGRHTQAASRALVASLRQSPEALAYLAKKLAEAA